MVCLRPWSGVSSLYKMLLRRSYLVFGVLSTSLLRSSASIGCVSLSAFQSHSRYWIEIFPVLLHSCSRHAFTTTTTFILLVRLTTVGSRTYPVSGAAVWSDLPAHITPAPSLAVSRQHRKTFLFLYSYPNIVILFTNYLFFHIYVLFRTR